MNIQKRKSVILLSGGLDSAANLAFCKTWDDPVLALTIQYGQKAAKREIEAAQKLCEYYQTPHQVIELDWLGKISHSSLNRSEKEIPGLSQNHLDDRSWAEQTAQSVWVPNRNGVFIHIAAAFAESMGAELVIVGFNKEEAATFPDNSEAYIEKVNSALFYSTASHVKVFSYTAQWNKQEIIRELNKLSQEFPLDKVWSCYRGGSTPCGHCESCQRFSRAVLARY